MTQPTSAIVVRKFRQILMWPLQLVVAEEDPSIRRHWEALQTPDCIWQEIDDEFTGDPHLFQQRHYHEFVTFLPYVQRFLYGGERGRRNPEGYGESPMRVFRRGDIARVRIAYDEVTPAHVFDIAHVDLYFFYDLDLAILVLEISADDLPLALAQRTLFTFGRAYPSFWHKDGAAGNCPQRVEWLSASGTVLAVSDYEEKGQFLSYTCEHRAPRIAAHWRYLLEPLTTHESDPHARVRVRQLEYYRMPLLAYMAVDDPRQLSRAQLIQLAFAGPPGDAWSTPQGPRDLEDFEQRYCYDRDWDSANIRFTCCGQAFVALGPARDRYFVDMETGVLGQFRHELFLLGLIAHFHRAALLMLSDRLIVAISRLRIGDSASVRAFHRSIRQSLENFLRFTHRYWFHAVSDQAQMKDLFAMWRRHLGTDELYDEVRDELQHMAQYLDSDVLRRHSNTMLRLTVVTILGLVGTITTGFLGMNVIDETGASLGTKAFYFGVVFACTIALTLYTVMKSRRTSEFLDSLSDERVTFRARWRAFADIWRHP